MSGGFSRIGMLLSGFALCSVLAFPAGAEDHIRQRANINHGHDRSGAGDFERDGHIFIAVAEGKRDWHRRHRIEHRGFGDGRLDGDRLARTRFHQRDIGFDYHVWAGRSHVRHLRMLASNGSGGERGSGISFVERGEVRDRAFAGSYSGSADVYRADGGTYVTGYSDGGYDGPSVLLLRPQAKIIDIAKAGSACAYENGVCVIRP